MCGLIGYSGRLDPAAMRAGLESIRHRGPDDSGTYFDEAAGIGLGHTRLSIIDLSPLGHQPMTCPAGNVWMVFNGEIYNYRELRAELESKGHTFRGHSDSEVLLHAFLEEGEACLPKLNGIFALAVYDRRSRETLIVRDAIGVKPLYYATTPRGVAYCSEIKGLLELVPECRSIDLVSIHRYLSYLWCPGNGTPLKDVRKLAPGEAMVVRDGAVSRRWSWYRLPVARGVAQDLDEVAAIHGVRATVRAAVARQMVADVPVGAFLSGGLDSSAVVAFARDVSPSIRCFTIETTGGAEEGATDDLPYAREVARHLGVTLEVVEIASDHMAKGIERMIIQLDEPLADPAPLNVLAICERARSQGIKVLLSGAGGDDLFSGYRRHRALELERAWGWLPSGVRGGVERIAASLDQRQSWARRLAKATHGAALDGDERVANYFRWLSEATLLALYTPAAREAIGDQAAADPLVEFLRELPRGTPRLERMLALEQRFFLADHNLTYTDKMSMAVGVEVRVPLLDLEVVEFAARIPSRYKQRGSVGKWVFKRSLEQSLPQHVIHRPKSGFGAPLRRWMRRDLRSLLEDVLGRESLVRRGIFDAAAVAALITANDTGRIDASYTLLSLMAVEVWCRRYLDCPASRVASA